MSAATMPATKGHSVASTLRPQGRVNVSGWERAASLAGGGALLCLGLSRRTRAGLLLAVVGGALAYRGATGHCHVYQSLGINTSRRRRRTSIPSGQGVKVEESLTMLSPRDALFNFWRNLENLPRVMQHLVSVTETGDGRSHWVAKGPAGNVEWDAEIIALRPGELIGWRSVEGSTVATAGSVHFQDAPGDRGTEVKVTLSYNPPAGQLGAALAWVAGRDAETEIRQDLRNFKRFMEIGGAMASNVPSRGRLPATA